jgi:two-component system sensor histidine kinase VicK
MDLMQNLQEALKEIRWRIYLATLVILCCAVGVLLWLSYALSIGPLQTLYTSLVLIVVTSLLIAVLASRLVKAPLKALGEAILYVTPDDTITKVPNFENLHVGRAYVNSLAFQLYEIANNQKTSTQANHKKLATQASNILDHFPIPVFAFGKDLAVSFGSDAGLNYVGLSSSDLLGKSLFEKVDMKFSDNYTLEDWFSDCQQNKATDTHYWRRVKIKQNKCLVQCDIAGYYSRDNPEGVEFVVSLFDRTAEYAQDDDSLSLIALAVHELRSPLTIMRGYVEALDEEMTDNETNSDAKQFALRLKASTKQLSGFVNNILNVARIEENQLTVRLEDTPWSSIVDQVEHDMSLLGSAREKNIIFQSDCPIPNVAADRSLIYEVLCNLIENSIKYSGDSTEIKITTTSTKDGLVETLVTDKGVGIPENVLPTLFERFHRNHRNRSQISGTGLGLYLAKVIIDAHDGDIWVKSKENYGTTVGFTLKPYDSIAQNGNSMDNNAMVRTNLGWIKNHNMFRR